MGKVRPRYIKSSARRLIALYPDRFTTDFEHNKQVLKELLPELTKRTRNRIAGYITRLMKIETRKKASGVA